MGELRPTDVRLTEMAARLRLTYTRDHLVELVETAARSHMTPRETLEYVFKKEVEQRDENRVRLAQMSAHFPFVATMEGFDMAFQPSIDPGKIRDLVSLEWVSSGENVVLIGPSGVGKTHLSIALGQLALQREDAFEHSLGTTGVAARNFGSFLPSDQTGGATGKSL